MIQNIAILGEGVTGKAVRKKLPDLGLTYTQVEDADLIVASPGIPPEKFPQTQVPIISEIEFAYRYFQREPQPPALIGVTGTNGKSTVTALLAHLLQAPPAGNFGIPLVSYLGQSHPVIVVELSSYQLECCTQFRPDIAVMLNITPDHLERHKTMAHYAQQKAKIFHSQTPQDTLIYWEDDAYLPELVKSAESQKIGFSKTHPYWNRLAHLPIVGEHNKLNALASILAALSYGRPEAEIFPKLFTFQALEHRIELVLTWKGRRFYNDSKGTNPDSTCVAVEAFTDPIHLLLGGKDKGLELEPFFHTILPKVSSITVYGEIAPRMLALVKKLRPHYPIYLFETLDQALEKSVALSQENEVILLSPACSSFDQFKDFNHRGEVFKSLVRQQYGTC